MIDAISNADATHIPSEAFVPLDLADAICLSALAGNAQFLRRMRPQTDRQKDVMVL
jgi:hypothetical protein